MLYGQVMKSSSRNRVKNKKQSHTKRENTTHITSIKIANINYLFDENCKEKWLNKFEFLDNADKKYILDFKEENVDSCFLGQGGSGFVFKYNIDDSQCAIKFSLNRQNRNEEVKKIMDIQRLFISDESPNFRITQFIEQGDTTIEINDNKYRLYYIVMDLADGTIKDLMCSYHQQGNTSKLIIQIKHLSETIQVLHKSAFAHRDIKPENILLKGDYLVLADFGLSGHTKEKIIRKKGPKYWPNPEFIQVCDENLQDIDEQSDIFNLGCLFFYFFTGRYPIGLIDIEKELVDINKEVKEILMDMLRYSKEDRLKNISDAIQVFAEAM